MCKIKYISQVAKEKALQLERKRKAAQFLAQLAEKKTTVSSVTPIISGGDKDGDSSAEEGEIAGGGGAAETDCHVSVLPCISVTV